MRLPLSLAISAPLYEVLPVLALALFEADTPWHRRTLEHSTTWQWEQSAVPEPAIIQLAISDEPTRCLIRINRPRFKPDQVLQKVINHIMNMLREYEFDFTLVRHSHQQPNRLALFIAPHKAPYLALAPLIGAIVEKYGLQLHHPTSEHLAPRDLQEMVQEAGLVIGVWDTLSGCTALYQSWTEQRPLLGLVRENVSAANWLNPLINYSQRREYFLQALDYAMAQRLKPLNLPDDMPITGQNLNGQQQIKGHGNPHHTNGYSATHSSEVNGAQVVAHNRRRTIYREVALDQSRPLAQRFHAARVLSESGDSEVAARALGDLLMAEQIGELANDGLALLGSLGKAAQPVLWYLDAQTADPIRAIAIARQLAGSGDVQTALFRLDQLAQHSEEEVRFAALDVMAETGFLATPHFQELAHYARDPKIRLKAVQWLYECNISSEDLIIVLKDLAWQVEEPGTARAAVELLAKMSGKASLAAMLRTAQRSPSAEARLAAAEELHERDKVTEARAALLKLALSSDDLAADAALEKLVDLSDQVTKDTTRLMNSACLKSVRRRAAEMLSQPHHPPSVQQAAARVLLEVDRPKLAIPVLGRLARHQNDDSPIGMARWAAGELAHLGQSAIEEIRRTFGDVSDPVVGQYLAEGLLAASQHPDDRREAALWLARHANLPRAIEVLRDMALSARLSGSKAVEMTNHIATYAGKWAGAGRALAQLVNESPHPAVRARALDLLLRDYPAELPLSLLVDLAVTGSIGAADRSPVIEQLNVMARPAAIRIAARLIEEKMHTERRWRLLELINELPQTAATQALLQISADAPQNRIRYVAAEQLIARGQLEAGYAALTTIAINEPDARLREMAIYELVQRMPQTEALLRSIIKHTRYQDSFHLTRKLLRTHKPSIISTANHWLDQLVLRWDAWVASLPLAWFDGLLTHVGSDRKE